MTTVSSIPGLLYTLGVLSYDEHDLLVRIIDDSQWSLALRRRTQHYGWTYSYDRRPLQRATDYLGPLPTWLQSLAHHIGFSEADQAIVNEYQVGQRISEQIAASVSSKKQ